MLSDYQHTLRAWSAPGRTKIIHEQAHAGKPGHGHVVVAMLSCVATQGHGGANRAGDKKQKRTKRTKTRKITRQPRKRDEIR